MKEKKRFLQILAFVLAGVICYSGFVSLLTHGRGMAFEAIAEESTDKTTGTLNYSDESVYEGEILHGKLRDGTGTFTWSTGEKYSGTWENDSPSGNGKLEWPGLGVYEGEFSNGKREGTGTFTWTYGGEIPEGAPISYVGDWVDDKIGTQGTLVLSGIGTYEGDFNKQQRGGTGTFTWLNGDVYTGSWARDTIEGQGTLTLNDGAVLEGTFGKGVLSKGTMTYKVPSGTVVRGVQYGKPQAAVEITYNDGTVVTGNVKGDEFTGNVTIKYPSGDTYVGTIKNGVKDGKGIYTWKSGAHYNGEWKNDKMSGKGKYCYTTDENTLTLTGTFKDGSPDGTLVYVAETKIKYQTTWSGGNCTSIYYKK